MLGDLNEPGLESLVAEIRKAGGYAWPHCSRLCSDTLTSVRDAIGLRCDVTSWEDQLKLFEAAIEAFHSVDIVVSC